MLRLKTMMVMQQTDRICPSQDDSHWQLGDYCNGIRLVWSDSEIHTGCDNHVWSNYLIL